MKWQPQPRKRIFDVPSSRTVKRPGEWELRHGAFVKVEPKDQAA